MLRLAARTPGGTESGAIVLRCAIVNPALADSRPVRGKV